MGDSLDDSVGDAGGTTLVLGASGFLGPHVVRRALARGGRVVAVARDPGRAGRALDGAEVEAADLLEVTEALLERAGPRRVVLVAALARIDACERDPELARATNAGLPERVAHWCARHSVRLVHVSTDLVFDGRPPRDAGYREGDSARPLHVYGASKLAGEQAVLARDRAALVVRLPLLYGDSGGRGLGASDWLVEAVEAGETPRLFTDEWRTPLEVGDAAAALVELACGDQAGRLHVAGPERVSRHDLGRAVLRARGHGEEEIARIVRPALRRELGLEAQRAADVSLDATRARALLRASLRPPEIALRAP